LANKILLVDGNGRSVRRTRHLLESSGYRVETAKSARSAVQAFHRLRPDLTLIDSRLRSESGFSVREQLRKIPHGRRASIVVLTPEDEESAFNIDLPGDCRASDFLARPCSDADLLSAVERWVSGPEDQEQAPSTNGRAVVGDLEAFGLAEIVQTIALSRKTAKIILVSGQRRGAIWFVDGDPLHAETGLLTGEEAFYRMLTWGAGRFEIDRRLRPADRSIDQDATYLIMEGLRRIDEAREHHGNGDSDHVGSPQFPSDLVGVLERIGATKSSESPTEKAASGSALMNQGRPRRGRRRLLAGALVLVALAVGGWQAREAGWLQLGWSGVGWPTERQAPPTQAPDVDLGVGITYADLPGLDSFMLFETEGPSFALLLDGLPEVQPGAGDLRVLDDAPVAPESIEQVGSDSVSSAPNPLPRGGAAPADQPFLSTQTADFQPFGPAVPQPGVLRLSARSTLKAGRLELTVDGQVVYTRELAHDKRASKRSKELFDEEIEVPPGNHTVVARLEMDDGAYGYESAVSVSLDPGDWRTLNLVAGKSKARPIRLTSE
jgi:CheY-like chemotaxis protein